MKFSKLFLLAAAAFPGCWSFGQTNIFPSSGNVGIGTSAPGAKLEVKGSVYVTPTSSTDGYVALSPGGPTYSAYVNWYRSGPTRLGYMGFQDLSGNPNNLALNLENSANFIIGGGNVGIGTATPSARLEVNGDASLKSSGHAYLFISGNTGDSELFWQENGASRWALGMNVGDGTENWNLYNFTTGAVNLSVNKMTGNVGIGTTTPDAMVQLRGSDPVNPTALTIQNTNAGGAVLRLERSSGIEGGSLTWDNNNVVFNIQTGASVPMAFKIGSGGEKMRIDATGNVGIGTTSPTQKLSVNGTVRAKEVIVETGWSDYVFEHDYALLPLNEVEQYVKAEKHLPGIPTAQEVAEKGISLGEMQAKLLGKIEELTLHVIAQEKEIKELRASLKTPNP